MDTVKLCAGGHTIHILVGVRPSKSSTPS